jgi:hypothetical protein
MKNMVGFSKQLKEKIKLMNRDIKLDLIRNSNPNMEFLNHLFE